MPPRADSPDCVVRYDPATLSHLSDAAMQSLLFETDRLNVQRARESSAAFVEYVLEAEDTGAPLTNAAFHREWHEQIRDNKWSLIVCSIGHAKTTHVSIGYVLWTIGKNPNVRIALVCDAIDQAKDRLGVVKRYISTSERLWKVFPHLKPADGWDRPAPGEKWSTQSITVSRTIIAKEPTVQAFGTGARDLEGKRFDLMIFDDVLNFQNTRTPEGCAKTVEWFDTTAITRLWPSPSAKVIVIGTPWANSDLLAVLQTRPGWVCRIYPAVHNPDEKPEAWRPIWPEVWPLSELLSRYANSTEGNFLRKYLCKIISDSVSRFREAWFVEAQKLGRGRTFLPKQPVLHPQMVKLRCFTGLDLGSSKRKRQANGTDFGSGLTVFFTIAVDLRGRRIPIDVQSGRWSGPVILDKLADVQTRYQSIVMVEDNGVQEWIAQFAHMRSIPVTCMTTTANNKFDEVYGVESMAVELRSGLWIWPSGADGNTVPSELKATKAELMAFHPSTHTGDRAMAMWFARTAAGGYITEVVRHLPTIPR